MAVTRINFQNFRNFQSLDLKTGQGFVVLAGPNGAGKTNLLEGIYFGASLRRFPDSKLSQMVKTGEGFYKIRLEHDTDQILEIAAERLEEKLKYKFKANNQTTTRLKYAGILPVVSFIPEDLNLLSHSPAGRRRFLDETLSVASAEYRHNIPQYNKVVKQRNELLERINKGEGQPGEIEIWDEQLADFGSQIIKQRAKLIDFFNANLSRSLKNLSPDLAESKIEYLPSGDADKQEFLIKVKDTSAREQALGRTMIGPHKDDFNLILNGEDVVGYLSRGQLPPLPWALKPLERSIWKENSNTRQSCFWTTCFQNLTKVTSSSWWNSLKLLNRYFSPLRTWKRLNRICPQTPKFTR